jgi:hypothetical protein
MEEAPADSRLARHGLEGGAGDPALRDAVPHRIDDALGLLAREPLFPVRGLTVGSSPIDGLQIHGILPFPFAPAIPTGLSSRV